MLFNFTEEEVNYFEEAKEVIGSSNNFVKDFTKSKNRLIAVISTIFILGGAGLILAGHFYLDEMGDFLLVPVGLSFFIPGVIARIDFGDAKENRNKKIDEISKSDRKEKAITYYRIKLFKNNYSVNTNKETYIQFFLMLALSQVITMAFKEFFNHEIGIVFGGLLSASVLYLFSELKSLISESETRKTINTLNELV